MSYIVLPEATSCTFEKKISKSEVNSKKVIDSKKSTAEAMKKINIFLSKIVYYKISNINVFVQNVSICRLERFIFVLYLCIYTQLIYSKIP